MRVHSMTDLVVQGASLPKDLIATVTSACSPASVMGETGSGTGHFVRFTNVVPNPAIDAYCAANRLDRAWVPAYRRWTDYRLLVMDMDSTLITIECIDEIADMVGVKPQVAQITAAAMRGELDFPGALRQRVALLAGLEESALQRVYDERLRLSPGAEILLAAAKKAGIKTLLVSGGFTFFTGRLERRLGLDATLANVLEIENGRLTGRVVGSIVDADAKEARLRAMCGELGCNPTQAIAIGDGANDLKMMKAAGVGIAYHAKPVVQAQATHALNHVGLDGVLGLFRE
jgi:phosphoserine phosphatase